ncbi:N-acetylglucosamine-6-phosphate deacetylase [Pseudonocardia sp. CA-142604]|uniref:N-acetylglucosamine-6-phosphate deacetylase n=1 Tax=Pseudonocardia sp. CA-142604 TaxID=3240024 RepID=UPI003D8BB8D5
MSAGPARTGTATTLLAADTVVTPTAVGPGWVELAGSRIASAGMGAPPRRADVDLGDAVLVPGFVDMHVHGGAGAAFPDGDPEQALQAVRFHRAHGSTTMMASLVAASPPQLLRAVDALADLVTDGELAGVHLEGPWLAAARCGAHDPGQLRDPDPKELNRLLRAGDGAVRMVTLAPERAGGLNAVRRISDAGVIAALGHTDASYALTRSAVAAGARVGTHLFNAMAPVHHREPGPAVALLEDARVTVELVTDGLHVHPALWEHVLRSTNGQRVAAVTDAMAAAGMPDGEYHLGTLRVAVTDRVARVADTGTIAGSTATTDALFANIVRHAALPREEALSRAVAMTAETPARALGLTEVGAIAPGRRADLVVLDPDLRVRDVYRAGIRLSSLPLAG